MVVLDSPRASEMTKTNIEIAYPAMSSTIEYQEWKLDWTERSVRGSKTVDIVFVTDLNGMERPNSVVVEILRGMLLQHVGLLVVMVEEVCSGGDSATKDLLCESGCSHRGDVLFQAMDQQYRITVFQGKGRESRFQ